MAKRRPDRKETKRSPDKSVIGRNKKVNVTFDEYKGVTVQSRQRISKWASVEIHIGNIPVDVDLLSFFNFIDKLAEGKCSRIRFMISYGYIGPLPSPQYLPRLIPRRRGE